MSPIHTSVPSFSAGAEFQAKVNAETLEATLSGCRVEFASGSRLAFDGSLAMPRDGRLVAALEGNLAAHAVELTNLVPEIDLVRAGGKFALDIPAATLALNEAAVSIDDASSRRMVEGTVTTVRPLVVDLREFEPRWREFQPDVLKLRVDGFPIAWMSRFVQQLRITSGTLHGELDGTVPPDRSLRVAGKVPFEARPRATVGS